MHANMTLVYAAVAAYLGKPGLERAIDWLRDFFGGTWIPGGARVGAFGGLLALTIRPGPLAEQAFGYVGNIGVSNEQDCI